MARAVLLLVCTLALARAASYDLVRAGSECLSRDTKLGDVGSVQECADAAALSGAGFFIFGWGDKEGWCWAEHTTSRSCPEGFEMDHYDFYAVTKPNASNSSGVFSFVKTRLGWHAANTECGALGLGELASVRSMAENAAIHNLCEPEACWLGYNDVAQEGTWIWSDGSAADFSGFPGGVAPWNPGEPNGSPDSASDAAYMYPSTNAWVTAGAWDDAGVDDEKAFVCRGPPPPPSPPPAPFAPHALTSGPFSYVAAPMAWAAARANCVALGGELASVKSMAENGAIHDLCMPEACWLGYNDVAQEGTWIWSDGSAANFSGFPGGVAPWNPGEPNGKSDSASDAAYMYPNTNAWVRAGTWDDDVVDEEKASVCRMPSPPPPPAGGGAPAGGGGGGVVGWLFALAALGTVAFLLWKRQRAPGAKPLFGPARAVQLGSERSGAEPPQGEGGAYLSPAPIVTTTAAAHQSFA